MDDNAAVLLESLGNQRAHVLGILDGLSDEQLRRPVLPSGWTCLGLVNHLALDVERFWFRAVVADEKSAWESFGEDSGSAWEVAPDVVAAAVFALYRDEIAQADRIITSTPIDTAPAAWPAEMFGAFRLADLRAVVVHVLTETACHAGHLDAVRELLDGHQWAVM
jgi:hypothetical protein